MNNQVKLSSSVAIGSFNFLVNGSGGNILETVGVLPQEVELLTGTVPWTGPQRVIIVRTMDSLIFGSMDMLGLPRFEVPAEYLAAAISVFVSPVNTMVASRWMESSVSANECADDGQSNLGYIRASARQIFALVLFLQESSETARFHALFVKKCGISIANVLNKDKPNAPQKIS